MFTLMQFVNQYPYLWLTITPLCAMLGHAMVNYYRDAYSWRGGVKRLLTEARETPFSLLLVMAGLYGSYFVINLVLLLVFAVATR